MQKTTEVEWVKSIKELLTHCPSLNSKCKISTQCKLPYAWEILSYTKVDERLSPTKGYEKSLAYETDLLIYEEVQEQVKPRIIIEAKYGNVTTHDAITYSHKASQHKAVTPYLRYGIMLGGMGQGHSLPGRLFRHGGNFDFMISFQGAELTSTEKASFVKLIESEWFSSRKIEEIFSESHRKNRDRYFMLQNALQLEKIAD